MKSIKNKDDNTLNISRIEPLSWWVGMKTPLQLMLYGRNIGNCKVRVKEKGVKIKRIHPADSPNYLFVDVEISPDAVPGNYTFEVTGGDRSVIFNYLIDKRKKDSANRKSYGAEDLIYLVMPDRFANGNPAINSLPDALEKVNREDHFGRHGGDLQGIMDHLDYFTGLGVTCLWLTPPQLDNEKQFSYHGYATADYYRIDPRFGTNELYKELVDKAHEKGLKVIMDAVPNHCGTMHWWMKDLPFKDWIHQHDPLTLSTFRLAAVTDPNASQKDLRQTVDGWFDDGMPDMAIENKYVLHYFLQVYIWWIEWANLDGLRVDTFPYNDKLAISEWTRRMREEYPRINIVAECWKYSPAMVAYWHGDAYNRDGYTSYLPTVMDFPLQKAIDDGLSEDTDSPEAGISLVYESIAHDFLYADPRKLLIFLDNHDVTRFADIVQGDTGKIKIGLTLLATLRGIPQLYYGTEWGIRSADPEKGHGAARKDFPGGWPDDLKDHFTGKGGSKKETEIYEYACKVFNWRKTAVAVHRGETIQFIPEKNTYSFVRYTADSLVFVLVNPSGKDFEINWQRYEECLKGFESGISVPDGEKVNTGQKRIVKACDSLILEFKK